MITGPLYTILLVFIGSVLLIFAYSLFTLPNPKKTQKKNILSKGIAGSAGVCPVCGSLLLNGAQIKSALFPGDKERLCHIFGCPNCYPFIPEHLQQEENIIRSCPVCKKSIPAEGYLIARLFERQNNKRHVHIIGCTKCRLSRKT